jgi:hypothetical protein
MQKVTEPSFNNWQLFFDLVSVNENIATIRYCPRPNVGGSLLTGIQFEIPVSWHWLDFKKYIETPEFIQAFWIENRLGDNPEKMWWRILDFFQPVFDDCPYQKTNSGDFCKRHLPIEYARILHKNGVELTKNQMS